MAKRKPGGGRKSMAGPTVSLTVRVPADMRVLLERGAKKRRPYAWSISQELIARLRQAYVEERKNERDPAIRALCFLIAETAHQIAGPHVFDEATKTEAPLFDWRSNPFFFRAFKLAVAQVLDSLQPPGEVKAPQTRTSLFPNSEGATQEEADSFSARFDRSFESPEARADYAAGYILNSLAMVTDQSIEEHREEARRLERIGVPSFLREHFGMVDAARDLKVNPDICRHHRGHPKPRRES
jgi:hypothetical protein